jgi:hypothetical protein
MAISWLQKLAFNAAYVLAILGFSCAFAQDRENDYRKG